MLLHNKNYLCKKSFCFCFVAGLAAARSEWNWETGKEYVYGYSGRLLTGIPELDSSHFSGLVRTPSLSFLQIWFKSLKGRSKLM
jgi:hypothetical protein